MNRAGESYRRQEDERQWVLAAKGGSRAAVDMIAEKYHAMIVKLSMRFNVGMQSSFSREELVQAGFVGLLSAIEHYTPQKSAAFGTYAFPWIIGEMRKAIKAAVNHAGSYDGIRQIRRAQVEFEAEQGREPSIMEIAHRCSMTCWQAAILMNLKETEYLDSSVDYSVNTMREVQKDAYQAAEWKLALDALPLAERQVIMLRYFRDLSQKETADAIGKSQTQISRIECRAMDRLRAWFRE